MKKLTVTIYIQKFEGTDDLPLPTKMSEFASGFDLYAAVTEPVTLEVGQRQLIPTGFAMAMPGEYEAQIRPRSGLAYKHGITCLNTPGTIDSDYRGEVKVLLINLGQQPLIIQRGERIAQMVIQFIPQVQLQITESLPDSVRGSGGFGHTGI